MAGDSTKLSFAGQSNKWNTAEDAAAVVSAIDAHPDLRILDLENNTLGPNAAKAIGDALAKHPEFQRAHFKDLFTGRLKTEIPMALKYLFSGINRAGAELRELDLSDNALGPVGVEGMVDFMCSPACYSLQELRLNNNGLGITGGTMLAKSLEQLLANSEQAGRPWKLKVFIAGRNRLEKVGAKIYAPIFEKLGSLEEIAMPQNGIFHEGIAALAKALSNNPNLRILNLNDNTFTVKGAVAMARHLPAMQALEVVNFGDCLLKTKGTIEIAKALSQEHPNLMELHLDGNEMTAAGGIAVAEAVENKKYLTILNLDCNQFGEEGRTALGQLLVDSGRLSALVALVDDEEPDSDAEEEDQVSEESESSSDEDTTDVDTSANLTAADTSVLAGGVASLSVNQDDDDIEIIGGTTTKSEATIIPTTAPFVEEQSLIQGPVIPVPCSAQQFLSQPTAALLLGLSADSTRELAAVATRECTSPAQRITTLTSLLVTSAALAHTSDQQLMSRALSVCRSVGEALFTSAKEERLVSFVSNSLLGHLGLIKAEDKSLRPTSAVLGLLRCLTSLAQDCKIPPPACDTLHFFINRPNSRLDVHPQEKNELLTALISR